METQSEAMISKVTVSKTWFILIISGKMKPLETSEQKMGIIKVTFNKDWL